MKSKLRKRGGLLIAAAVILSLAFIAAITAYLTDKDNFATSIKTASTSDIDISISGTDLSETLVTHGEEVELSPVISNDGAIPVYVFASISADEGLTPEFSSDWTQYSDTVYYYGSGELSPLDPNSTLTVFDSVVVDSIPDQNVETEQDELNISVDAYALQTGGFDPSDISTAWDMASATTTP